MIYERKVVMREIKVQVGYWMDKTTAPWPFMSQIRTYAGIS